jgi:hypothetical protein
MFLSDEKDRHLYPAEEEAARIMVAWGFQIRPDGSYQNLFVRLDHPSVPHNGRLSQSPVDSAQHGVENQPRLYLDHSDPAQHGVENRPRLSLHHPDHPDPCICFRKVAA